MLNSVITGFGIIFKNRCKGDAMPLKRVSEAIEAIRRGEMIIMMDDEDRENEGDLVYAAAFSTPEKVNFMVTEAKGLVCVCVTQKDATRLELVPMVKNNSSQHETAFTVSVDAMECSTGISAFERDLTIRKMVDSSSRSGDFARPGHIFPLIAKDGGVLVRTGHTEGSVDICKLAGVAPVAVICEIIKKDGHMARRNDLMEFATQHGLKILYISDLVEYRIKNETLLQLKDQNETEFLGKKATKFTFIDHNKREHVVYLYGKIEENLLVKYHTIGKDLSLLENEKKYSILMQSIHRIQREGGLLVFMDAPQTTTSQVRDLGIGAQILRHLGVKNFRLLTQAENREYVGLAGFGLNVVERIVLNAEEIRF